MADGTGGSARERGGSSTSSCAPSRRGPDDDPVALFIRRHGVATVLLAEHVDDGTGRCAVCSAGGQTGRVRWPCSIASAAVRAQGATSST